MDCNPPTKSKGMPNLGNNDVSLTFLEAGLSRQIPVFWSTSATNNAIRADVRAFHRNSPSYFTTTLIDNYLYLRNPQGERLRLYYPDFTFVNATIQNYSETIPVFDDEDTVINTKSIG